MLQRMNDEIVKVWLILFLKRIGKKQPEFLMSLLNDLNISNKQIEIMKARYIDKLSWDNIPPIVHRELRTVYKLHKEVIQN